MSVFIDLSHEINSKTPNHPYDEKMRLYQTKTLKKDSYNDSRIETGMHLGTHIDASSHMLNSNQYICDYPIDKFIGEGIIINAEGLKKIDTNNINVSHINENNIVLIYTGFDKYFGEDKYFNEYPMVTENFAEFLLTKNIKLLGIDTPSPDYYPFNVHKILLEKEILIAENLKNLDKLLKINNFKVLAIPLKIRAEGSLLRIFAEII